MLQLYTRHVECKRSKEMQKRAKCNGAKNGANQLKHSANGQHPEAGVVHVKTLYFGLLYRSTWNLCMPSHLIWSYSYLKFDRAEKINLPIKKYLLEYK